MTDKDKMAKYRTEIQQVRGFLVLCLFALVDWFFPPSTFPVKGARRKRFGKGAVHRRGRSDIYWSKAEDCISTLAEALRNYFHLSQFSLSRFRDILFSTMARLMCCSMGIICPSLTGALWLFSPSISFTLYTYVLPSYIYMSLVSRKPTFLQTSTRTSAFPDICDTRF